VVGISDSGQERQLEAEKEAATAENLMVERRRGAGGMMWWWGRRLIARQRISASSDGCALI
jgi:hypothetical protein